MALKSENPQQSHKLSIDVSIDRIERSVTVTVGHLSRCLHHLWYVWSLISLRLYESVFFHSSRQKWKWRSFGGNRWQHVFRWPREECLAVGIHWMSLPKVQQQCSASDLRDRWSPLLLLQECPSRQSALVLLFQPIPGWSLVGRLICGHPRLVSD